MHASLALVALAVDALCGYPQGVYRTIGHPVSWVGRLIAWCDRAWNREQLPYWRRRAAGVLTVVLCLAAALAVSVALVALVRRFAPAPLDWLLIGLAAAPLIAQRSLHAHVHDVAAALEAGDLALARSAVARIVGRDTAALPEAGVARAAIESLAENFSDGVVAPVFWLLVGGLPGAAAYKAVNTADSMVGHKTQRYRAFGWASARLDDLLNLPASRLAALWLAAAAALLPDASGRAALSAVLRDARRHRSPNAGWPESAMAGALGLKLAGPRLYGGVLVGDAWMGHGRSEADAGDIRAALRLYRLACVLQAACIALMAAL